MDRDLWCPDYYWRQLSQSLRDLVCVVIVWLPFLALFPAANAASLRLSRAVREEGRQREMVLPINRGYGVGCWESAWQTAK